MTSINLPLQLTNFIGRVHEIVSLEQILSAARLVTLVGVGGCGKTRLAIEFANRISENFPDGVWFVPLASLREPSLIPQTVVETLGLHLHANQPLLAVLKDFLQSKQVLLVLDNCEHLITDCAELFQQLLSHAVDLRILATSREPLGIAGESIYPLLGMNLPDWVSAEWQNRQSPPDLENLMKFDAVHLFVDRTRALFPHFALTVLTL